MNLNVFQKDKLIQRREKSVYSGLAISVNGNRKWSSTSGAKGKKKMRKGIRITF
jgi:hypothetical protein